jgi:hypothetical protein
MEVKKLIKISQPHVLSILGLFLLNVFFFYPLVNGKKLKQEDINQFESITRFNQTNHDNSFIETEAFAIINPSIIKLADGTNTTFDANNPDIRYKQGGNVNEIAYHISDKDFDFFDKNKIGTNDLHLKRKKDEVGFFFTKSEWDINSMISVNFRYKRNPIVYVCELNYNNPYTFEDLEKSDFYGFVNKNMGGWNIYDRFTNEIISDAKRLNKDAIYLNDFIVVFEPTQINILKKEKIKKGQIYQLNNPDIRFAGGGSVEELKFSNEIESDAMGYDIGDYLYHITPVSNFNTIINKGFIPKNGISINGKPFENRLYFATSLISAYDLSVNFGSYRDDAEYVIFKIKSDCIDDYEEDDLFAHGIYVDYKVSNKCIVGYVNADDLFNKFDDEDLENLYY